MFVALKVSGLNVDYVVNSKFMVMMFLGLCFFGRLRNAYIVRVSSGLFPFQSG